MTTQTTQSVNSQIGQPATADFNLLSLPKASDPLTISLEATPRKRGTAGLDRTPRSTPTPGSAEFHSFSESAHRWSLGPQRIAARVEPRRTSAAR